MLPNARSILPVLLLLLLLLTTGVAEADSANDSSLADRGTTHWGETDPGSGSYWTGGLAQLGDQAVPTTRTLEQIEVLTVDPRNGDLLIFDDPEYYSSIVQIGKYPTTVARLRRRDFPAGRENGVLDVVAMHQFETALPAREVIFAPESERLYVLFTISGGPPHEVRLGVFDVADTEAAPRLLSMFTVLDNVGTVEFPMILDEAANRLSILAWEGQLAVVDLDNEVLDESAVSEYFPLPAPQSRGVVFDRNRSLVMTVGRSSLGVQSIDPATGEWTPRQFVSIPYSNYRWAYQIEGTQNVVLFDETGISVYSFSPDAKPSLITSTDASFTGSTVVEYDHEGEQRFVLVAGSQATSYAIREGVITLVDSGSFTTSNASPAAYDAQAEVLYMLAHINGNPTESYVERHQLGVNRPLSTLGRDRFVGRALGEELISFVANTAENRILIATNTDPASLATARVGSAGLPIEYLGAQPWLADVPFISDLAADFEAGIAWAITGQIGQAITTIRISDDPAGHEIIGTETYAFGGPRPTNLTLSSDGTALWTIREQSGNWLAFDRYDLDPTTHLPVGLSSTTIVQLNSGNEIHEILGTGLVAVVGDQNIADGRRSMIAIIDPGSPGVAPSVVATRQTASSDPGSWESGSSVFDPRNTSLVVCTFRRPGQSVFRWDLSTPAAPTSMGGQNYDGVGHSFVFDPESHLLYTAPYDSKWGLSPTGTPIFFGGLSYIESYEPTEGSRVLDRQRGLILRTTAESIMTTSVTLQPSVQLLKVTVIQPGDFDRFYWYSHADRGNAWFAIYKPIAGGMLESIWESESVPLTAPGEFLSLPIRNEWGGTIPRSIGAHYLAWRSDDWAPSIGMLPITATIESRHYFYIGPGMPDFIDLRYVTRSEDFSLNHTLGETIPVPNGVALR